MRSQVALTAIRQEVGRLKQKRAWQWVRRLHKKRDEYDLTNQLDWAASSVADLYRCRWQVEVVFRQIKQTLQLADFLGHNENAVRWQVWTALLLDVLLRFIAGSAAGPGTFRASSSSCAPPSGCPRTSPPCGNAKQALA